MKRAYLWLFFLLVFSFSPFAVSDVLCSDVFEPNTSRIQEVHTKLVQSLSNKEKAIENLKLNEAEISGLNYLGDGDTGTVYKVSFHGKAYALKIFTKGEYKPEITRDAIHIQRILAELDMAPAVIGVLDKKSTDAWIRRHFDSGLKDINSLPKAYFAMMMELVDTKNSLKERGEKLKVTAATKDKLLNKVDYIVNTLDQLNIRAIDEDAVIFSDGKFMLIDLAFYTYDTKPDKRRIEFLRYEIKNRLNQILQVID